MDFFPPTASAVDASRVAVGGGVDLTAQVIKVKENKCYQKNSLLTFSGMII